MSLAARVRAAAAAAAVALLGTLAPAAPPVEASCAWRMAAQRLLQELAHETAPRAIALRGLLAGAGVAAPSYVPVECRTRPPVSGGRVTPPQEPGTATGQGITAAAKFGWGRPNRVDEFSSAASAGDWNIYDGPGHAGNGRRTPDAVSINDGVLTITGSPDGDTAGMAWNPGQKYGRWEGRVKAPVSDESYNALLLLWPDAEDFPVGGEIDFMEMMDHTRQTTNMFLHYGADNSQVSGEVNIDATQWHNWALEWTPDRMTAFVDGVEWWSITDSSIFPPGPMHLCIQLDWFPGDASRSVQQSEMQVAWVKQYSLTDPSSGTARPIPDTAGGDDNPLTGSHAQESSG